MEFWSAPFHRSNTSTPFNVLEIPVRCNRDDLTTARDAKRIRLRHLHAKATIRP